MDKVVKILADTIVTIVEHVLNLDKWAESLTEKHNTGATHNLAVASKLTNRIGLLEREGGKASGDLKSKLEASTLWDAVNSMVE